MMRGILYSARKGDGVLCIRSSRAHATATETFRAGHACEVPENRRLNRLKNVRGFFTIGPLRPCIGQNR